MILDASDVDFVKEIYVKQFSNFRNRKVSLLKTILKAIIPILYYGN